MALTGFRAARWIRTLNLLLQAVLFLTFFAGLNYVALHFAWRFDLTRMHRHSLSAETRSYLGQLSKPVTIVTSFGESGDAAETAKYLQAATDLNELLSEYIYATEPNLIGKISVKRLDVFRQPREAQIIGIEQNQILINCAGKNRVLRYEDIYQFREGKPTSFIGEQAITTAILEVDSTNRKKIYFLIGHGELEPADVSGDRGISQFKDQLNIRNFDLDKLDLRERRKVPDDASLLIIPRPTSAYDPAEQEALRQYMSTRAGRILLLIEPSATEFGLGDLLYDWGVLADRAYICDSSADAESEAGGLIFKTFLAGNPITQPMIDQKQWVSFGVCRSVRVNPSKANDESLIASRIIGAVEKTSWGERDLLHGPPRFDPTVDIMGKFVGAAVASERVGQKAELNFSVPRGRIVVIGCADFITNNRIGIRGNLTLALSSVNWLVDRDTQVNIAPRPIEKFQLALSQHELLRLRYVLLFGLPAGVALIGLVVYWTRRR